MTRSWLGRACARRGRALVPFAVGLIAVACGSGDALQRGSGAGTPLAAPTPAPAPADVPGAAEMPEVPETPADIAPLASRFEPRRLPIPRVGSGRHAGFTFDGGRRGWFARLPEYARMKLVTPVYGDGKIFIGGGFGSHRFYALNAHSGRMEWSTAASDGGPTAAIVESDKVIFNTESCTLFVVDQDTGRLRWKRWLGDPLMGQPAAHNGRVFSGHIRNGGDSALAGNGGSHGFTAMSLRSGRVLWTRDIPADVMNAPVLDETDVYFTTMDGTVWRMNQRTGRVRWRRRVRATSAPWLDGDQVLVAKRHRGRNAETGQRYRAEKTVVLAKANGRVEREFDGAPAPFLGGRPDASGVEAGWVYEGSRPTIVDGRLYQTIGNEVHSRNAATGELLWRRRYTDRARTRPASPPAVAGSQLVFGTRDGVLYGLDIDTGMTAWAYQVGEAITAQPVVARGWVYASTTRGGVVGLEIADARTGGWHMWGGNARHNGTVAEPAPATASGGTDGAEGGGSQGAAGTAEGDERPGQGVLQLSTAAQEGELGGFPLEGTSVQAQVSGFVARVTVEQTFRNPYERPVEAVYLFPLPDDAAVDAMELHAGSRVVRGQIRRRAEARREYRAARRRGVLASLLEQERPNLFRQSVANIRPGDQIRVVLKYTQVLPYEAGSYRFVFPMVAGPRYAPAGQDEESRSPIQNAGETQNSSEHQSDRPSNTVAQANGTSDEHAEQAGHDVQHTVLAPGVTRADRVRIQIDADMGSTLHAVTSPTHAVQVSRRTDTGARVTLGDEGVAPDRDLDVRFRVAGDAPTVALLTSPPEGHGAEARDGFLTLMVHPRLTVPTAEVSRRELVFVVDSSSSMHGLPMEMAKRTMARALDGLRPDDTFRVLRFSDAVSSLAEAPLAANETNVRQAKAFVDGMQALGATEMKAGLRAALGAPEDAARMRIVVLLTDGYIGNESEVLREASDHLGKARLFAFGVGSAVNRYLLTRLADVGRGQVQVVTLDESAEEAADAFHARIAAPYLTDIRIDWGGLDVRGVYPRRVPDLYAGQSLVVHARYGRGGAGRMRVRGRIAGRAFEQLVPVTLPAAASTDAPRRQGLASLWARTAIRDLMTAMALRPSDALREQVTELGLEYSLMTQWTSFVAVDEGYRTGRDGEPDRVDQPSTLPAGVDYGSPAGRRARAASSSDVGTVGAMRNAVGQSMGYGGLGLRGTGRGGGGSGYGAIGAGRIGAVQVSGTLSRSAVQATIRAQLPAFRAAYERALRTSAGLRGRVVLSLVIASDGHVTSATIASSSLGNDEVHRGLLAVARRLRFPAVPGGGTLTVSYPFVFSPGGGSAPAASSSPAAVPP